jgi:glucose-6-phosphate dehydrogenase assembly protein OpcA
METERNSTLAREDYHEILTQLGYITQKVDAVAKKVDEIDDRVSEIENMALKYKGGFLAILSLGAFAGWVMSNFDWIKQLFEGR